jgi:type IV pilus assembly protein PilV
MSEFPLRDPVVLISILESGGDIPSIEILKMVWDRRATQETEDRREKGKAMKMRFKVLQRLLVKKSEGFTLIEVMIALVILAVGLLGLAALQLTAIKSNAFSSEMTYATMKAQQYAEVFKSLPFADSNLTAGSHTDPTPPTSKGVQYTIKWTVTDNVPATDMKSISITVQWQSLRQGAASQTAAQQTVTANLQTIVRNAS